MPRRSPPIKSVYARQFPHQVDLPDLPQGYGRRLNEMHEWCRRRCGESWAVHGGTFYFGDPAIAAEFKATYLRAPG